MIEEKQELMKPTPVEVVDVETAKAEWETYQKLVRELLDDSDYQEYNQNGTLKKFPKKSAWAKLGRAFNVNTEIIDKEFVLTKTGETREAYYCIRATLPNGRTVESDGSCSRHEKGKGNATSHTIRSTAKTRATNRAISELIGAGEVSAEELDPSFHNGTPVKKVVDVPAEEITVNIGKDVTVDIEDDELVLEANTIDNAEEIAHSIIEELPSNNKNLLFAKLKLKELLDKRIINEEECPSILKELEVQLNGAGK